MNIAVIVETRPLDNLQQIIDDHMRFLPGWELDHVKDVHMQSPYDYNNLMTSTNFWEKYIEYDSVLIFQHDSMILKEGIDEFLGWDYVGSPWKTNMDWARRDRKGGNGGFSLRNPRKMIETLKKNPYQYTEFSKDNEDVYFIHYLEKVEGKIAPYEVCRKFSCESIFELGTFGYHQIESHLSPEQCEEIKIQYIYEKQG